MKTFLSRFLFALLMLALSMATRAGAVVIKLSDYTSNSSPAAGDLLWSVDVSDTSMAASGTTKKMTISALTAYYAALSVTETNKTLTAPTITGGVLTALTTLGMRSSGAAFDISMGSTEVLTAGRTILWNVGDTDRDITLGGDVTTGGDFTTGGAFTTVSTFSSGGAFSTAGAFTTGGAVTVSGAFALTLTITADTSLTLPTSGTVLTNSSSAVVTGKTINGPDNTLTNIANASLANSAITIGGAATSLGGTVTATTILDSLGSTQGSLLYRNGTVWTALTPGTAGKVLTSGGAAADPTFSDAPLPTMYVTGLMFTSNASDATNDVDIAAGAARDASDVKNIALASAITKRSDASWAVGTGNGWLDTGAIANGTYYVWLILRSDTGVVDSLLSLSATAPTMPASYDYKRRIGIVVRAGSAVHALVTETGNGFVGRTITDFVTTLSTSTDTGLQFYAAANETWQFEVRTETNAPAAGTKFQVTAPTSATVKGESINHVTTSIVTADITAINTLGAVIGGSSTNKVMVNALISNSSTAGVMGIGVASTTATQTTTITAKSYFVARRCP